ncbi:MAG: DUF4445 domain-containing protein [Chitinivibrionales bacterium]|nr:DUF4445 domain-containing protein [Chitinivibrionales bacterium]MBD3396924.1 DUF4445 domain-containing protein [Chitinivibrionales bacterium]
MPRVTFQPSGKSIEISAGMELLEAARRAGVNIETPCGGKGACGKCIVRMVRGEIDTESSDRLTPGQRRAGYVLACRTRVNGSDITVEIPRPADRERGQFGDNLEGISLLNPLLVPKKDDLVPLTEESHAKVSAGPAGHHYGIAVDVGTTTIAVLLVSLPDARVAAVHADYNGQLSCGTDVIGRINYARREGGQEQLRALVLDTINRLMQRAAQMVGIEPRSIAGAAVSGNTTMMHLLLGIDPECIRVAPYQPAVLEVGLTTGHDIGLDIHPAAPVAISPAVGSYVGGDITAGILCTDLAADTEDICLFMDIGTNGELVVGNRDFLMTCACSAGPAFEGGGIDCGMRAAEGAIERVEVDSDTGNATVSVIGGVKPRGVCGSGMITLLAGLFTTGWLDQAGKLNRARKSPAIREEGRRAVYTIVSRAQSGTGGAIEIDELDIENIKRTKAAVYSACALMLEQIGIGFDALSKVYIAGGFGRFIDLQSAVTIGLLPDIHRDKFHFVGNTSLTGTYMLLVSRRHREKQKELVKRMTYVELNTDPSYMDQYTGALFLPHTDTSLFPSVKVARE